MPNRVDDSEREQTSERAFRDAGFTVERVGSVTIYRRPVSEDVIEASMYFARKRAIGFLSKDIPGRREKCNR
jgi:hypothetical protein